MKIVIVIDSWNKGNGGVVVTHTLVSELQARGHEISLVTTAGEAASKFKGKVTEVAGMYLPGIRESLESMGFKFGLGMGQNRKYRKAFKGADLVHVVFPFFMARNAVNVAKRMKIPVLGAAHIQSQNLTGAMGKDSPFMDRLFNAWFNFQLFNRVNAIHCPSQHAADLLKSKKCKSHLRVVSNGIPRDFVPMENAQRPEFFGDKFVILNIGRHAMEKRQESIIDAVLKSRYKEHILLLLCGKGEDTDKLRERGRELPVEPLVKYISEEEKHLFYNTADMYVHASGVELESRTCLEAVGSGLPCLIEDSPHSASSQFAMDERFLFTSNGKDEMTVKIDFWYENREVLAGMKNPVLESAEKYRIDNAINAMDKLYSDVVDYHYNPNGQLPQGETIGPLLMKK